MRTLRSSSQSPGSRWWPGRWWRPPAPGSPSPGRGTTGPWPSNSWSNQTPSVLSLERNLQRITRFRERRTRYKQQEERKECIYFILWSMCIVHALESFHWPFFTVCSRWEWWQAPAADDPHKLRSRHHPHLLPHRGGAHSGESVIMIVLTNHQLLLLQVLKAEGKDVEGKRFFKRIMWFVLSIYVEHRNIKHVDMYLSPMQKYNKFL